MPSKRMTYRRAVGILIRTAGMKLAGSGCGLPGGHVQSSKEQAEVARAIAVAWRYVYGRAITESELFNLQVPCEFWSVAEAPDA